MASDIRVKSSFCGFTDIVGSGVVSFDRVTAESNVDGASIDGGTGLVTVGAESSYQVDRILCTGLEDACTSWLEYILEYIYGGGNFDTWTSFFIAGVSESSDENRSRKHTQVLGLQEWGEHGNGNLLHNLINVLTSFAG